MKLVPFAALVLTASTGLAMADPINDTGWKISCDDAGCQIASGGFALWTTADSSPDALQALQALPDMSAVSFAGEMSNMGDSTADLTLTEAAHIDDINEGNLQAMQGDWVPQGEETPYFVRIIGMEWQEWANDEMVANFAMTAGDACADGVTPGGGTVINLYRIGDDPGADACWQVEGIAGGEMDLRDFQGEAGQVVYNQKAP